MTTNDTRVTQSNARQKRADRAARSTYRRGPSTQPEAGPHNERARALRRQDEKASR